MQYSRGDIIEYWQQRSDVNDFFIANGYDIESRADDFIGSLVRDAIGDSSFSVDRHMAPVDQETLDREVFIGLDLGTYFSGLGADYFRAGFASDSMGVSAIRWIRSLTEYNSVDEIDQVEFIYFNYETQSAEVFTGSMGSWTFRRG